MINFCYERAFSSYKAGKFYVHDFYSHVFAYVPIFSFFLHGNIISCKDSNLLLRGSLSKDLSFHGVVNVFGLPILGNCFTVLVRKNLLHTKNFALIGQPTIDIISQNPFALF